MLPSNVAILLICYASTDVDALMKVAWLKSHSRRVYILNMAPVNDPAFVGVEKIVDITAFRQSKKQNGVFMVDRSYIIGAKLDVYDDHDFNADQLHKLKRYFEYLDEENIYMQPLPRSNKDIFPMSSTKIVYKQIILKPGDDVDIVNMLNIAISLLQDINPGFAAILRTNLDAFLVSRDRDALSKGLRGLYGGMGSLNDLGPLSGDKAEMWNMLSSGLYAWATNYQWGVVDNA